MPYLWYDGEMWVVLYREVEVRDRLPAILTPTQVESFGDEIARFHRACSSVSRLIPPTSKTVTSDAVNLYEMTASRRAGEELGLDPSRLDMVHRHAHRFLMAVHECGYDYWPKMPVLIDWNLGNFSIERARREFPAVQPMGLRLVPSGDPLARLLLLVAGVLAHG